MADEVAGLMDVLGVPEAVVGGLSMGGYVAMAMLRRHPQRVSRLILADTKATRGHPGGGGQPGGGRPRGRVGRFHRRPGRCHAAEPARGDDP